MLPPPLPTRKVPRHDVGILPIKAEYVAQIFSGAKNIEFRTWFPENFQGTIFIYECGSKSRHAVVGYFTTPFVIKIAEDGEVLGQANFEKMPIRYQNEVVSEACPNEFCIPICNRTQFTAVPLYELDRRLNVTKPTEFPRGFRWLYVPRPFNNPFKEEK